MPPPKRLFTAEIVMVVGSILGLILMVTLVTIFLERVPLFPRQEHDRQERLEWR